MTEEGACGEVYLTLSPKASNIRAIPDALPGPLHTNDRRRAIKLSTRGYCSSTKLQIFFRRTDGGDNGSGKSNAFLHQKQETKIMKNTSLSIVKGL